MNLKTASSRKAQSPVPLWAQAGVGLIEVLVAVLLLSIGILGIAALQTRAVGNSGNAMGRSMATLLSYSILEAMRIDAANARSGTYNTTVPANNCPGEGASLAGWHLHFWCDSLAATLGAAATTTGKVHCDGDGNCSITINWNDNRNEAGAGGGTQTLTTVAKL